LDHFEYEVEHSRNISIEGKRILSEENVAILFRLMRSTAKARPLKMVETGKKALGTVSDTKKTQKMCKTGFLTSFISAEIGLQR
jgi:hypothetical protein